MTDDIDAYRASLADYDLVDHADRVLALARPCIALRNTNPRLVPAGRTRLGGQPDLPEGLAWPEGPGGPMTFLAQIDLAALAPSDLPHDGLLSFFFDRSDFHEGADVCRVLHLRGALAPRAVPPGLEEFQPRPLAAIPGRSFPYFGPSSPWIEVVVPNAADVDDVFEALLDWSSMCAPTRPPPRSDGAYGRTEDEGPTHQLLGYPRDGQRDILTGAAEGQGIEDPMAAARGLRLLLQLVEDRDAGFAWVDSGSISFILSEADLATQRFDRAWCVVEFD